jgi:hypothetical protein
MVIRLLFSGLPSTVTLPLTSARFSPQPTHPSNVARQRKMTSGRPPNGQQYSIGTAFRKAIILFHAWALPTDSSA